MQRRPVKPRVIDYDRPEQEVPVTAREMAGNCLRIVVKLLATLCMIGGILFATATLIGRPPARLRESNLLGKSIAQVQQELGPAHSDSRANQRHGAEPTHLIYNYGWGQRCMIEFDDKEVAVKVVHFSK